MFTLSGLAFQGSEELRVIIREWMVEAGPLVPEGMVQDLQSTLSSSSGAGITGLLGVITLLWLVSRLFGTIRTAFDRVFDVPGGRNPILGKLFDFVLALLVSISLFSASVMTTLALLVRDSPAGQIAGQWPLVGRLIGTGSARLLGWVFVILLYFMLFWAAPNRRVSLRQAGAATILAALLSHVGTKFYLWTISRPDWGVVYGSLATVMATFLWVYWICVMLLASAEISQILHEWLKVRRSLRLVRPAAG
jgi:YihY family inner membrane protein